MPVSLVIRVFIAVFAAASLFAQNSLKPDAAAPAIAFDGQVVKASNITHGGQVVFFAVGLVPNGWQSTVVRWSQVVTDDDHDGTVTYDAGQKVPCKSIWVVAEVQNGHFAVAAPSDCPLQYGAALDSKSFKKNGKGDLELFLQARPYLDLLYIHPGKGVWTISAADSYPSDADGESNGVTAIALSSARSLTGEAPPKDFVPGGVLVAIDLYKLDVVAERLDGKTISGVQQ